MIVLTEISCTSTTHTRNDTGSLSEWARESATGGFCPDGAGEAVGPGVEWRLWT